MENEDKILECFISLVEKFDIGTSITLFVNGQIITGRTISTKNYLSLLSENFKNSHDKKAQDLGDDINEVLKPYINSNTNEVKSNNPKYIHINMFKIIDQNNNIIKFGNNPLRIKISNIQGYIFGEMQDI